MLRTVSVWRVTTFAMTASLLALHGVVSGHTQADFARAARDVLRL